MKYEDLFDLIEKGLSSHSIAKALNCSQTNVRYWLRKHGLNTKNTCDFDSKNGKYCSICSTELTGSRHTYCSNKCRTKRLNPNTCERQRRVGPQRKIDLIKKAGGKCSICGYKKNIAALNFHHRNPQDKVFTLDVRKLSNTRLSSILLEFEKCDLLCSNCHFEAHNPRFNDLL